MSKLTLLGSVLIAVPVALVATPALATSHNSSHQTDMANHWTQLKDEAKSDHNNDKPCDKPEAQKPCEKPAEKPCDKPEVKPCDKPQDKPCEKPQDHKPCDKPVEKPCKPTTPPGKGGGETPTPPVTSTTPAPATPQPQPTTLPQTGGELPIANAIAVAGAIGVGLVHRKLQANKA